MKAEMPLVLFNICENICYILSAIVINGENVVHAIHTVKWLSFPFGKVQKSLCTL